MCEAATIATTMAIVLGTSEAVNQYGQYKSAKAQESALNRQAKTAAEENQAAAESQLGERVRESRRERSRIVVAAGESGVAGASLGAQLSNSLFQQGSDVATIRKQAWLNQRAADARTASAMAQINKPNILSAGLQIAGSAFTGYAGGMQIAGAAGAAGAGSAGTVNSAKAGGHTYAATE